MPNPKHALAAAFSAVEGFFDRLKLGYKWRFDRWFDLRIIAYRGYGTPERLHLRGRVIDDKAASRRARQSVWQNIVDTLRRIETDEVPGARVRLLFAGRRLELTTDEDGYFEAELLTGDGLDPGRAWQEVALELLAPEGANPVRAKGQVLVPPPDAEFGVISDVDDTVVRTGATDRFRMTRTVLLNNAQTRVPFEGIAAFYRALQQGPDGRGHNPICYISSSPWNLYELFESFMEFHGIPVGPLFLKDFGFTRRKILKHGHEEHKLTQIERLLETWPALPFVLIGDSGQKDPETYREAVRRHPERIRAVYIRDVTPDRRDADVRAIAEEVERLGVPMVLAEDTVAVAEHAAEHGLITEEAVEEVRAERDREQEEKKEPSLLERILGG